MTDLPAMERTHLRVLASWFHAVGTVAVKLSPESRAYMFGESGGLIANWETLARKRHASTTDAPSETDRSRTVDAA